jgi:hypothetical protein
LKREAGRPKKHSDYRKLATLDKRAVEGSTKATRAKARRQGQDIRDSADKALAVTRRKLNKIMTDFESQLVTATDLDDSNEIKDAGLRAITRAKVAQAFTNLTPVKLRLCELVAVRTPFQIILNDPIIVTAIESKELSTQQIRTMSSEKARNKSACLVVDEIRSQIPALHADWRAGKRTEIIEAGIETGKVTGLDTALTGLRDADAADTSTRVAQPVGQPVAVNVNVQQVTGAALLAQRMEATISHRQEIDDARMPAETIQGSAKASGQDTDHRD